MDKFGYISVWVGVRLQSSWPPSVHTPVKRAQCNQPSGILSACRSEKNKGQRSAQWKEKGQCKNFKDEAALNMNASINAFNRRINKTQPSLYCTMQRD